MKNIRFILALAGCCAALSAAAGEEAPAPQIVNVAGRETVSLDGLWKTIVDPYENGYYDYRRKPLKDNMSYFADDDFDKDRTKLFEYNFNTDRTLLVPGDWNTQRPQLYYYEGTVWYRNLFDYEPRADRRTFLYFGAANYETIVGLNGRKIGKHVGGYTPFNFEITGKVREGRNSLVVKVDNKRLAEGVPTLNSDWWNYGGLTRSVVIVETPLTFIRDYSVQLKKGEPQVIAGWVQLDGAEAEQTVTVEIPELKISKKVTTDADGYAAFEVKAKPVYWSPENPKLYAVRIAAETDSVDDRIGFRTIETRGTKILLNGREVFCRGVSIHEEMPYGMSGRAFSAEHARILLGWAKEMGCNFVRGDGVDGVVGDSGLLDDPVGESRDLCQCRSAAGGHDHARQEPRQRGGLVRGQRDPARRSAPEIPAVAHRQGPQHGRHPAGERRYGEDPAETRPADGER